MVRMPPTRTARAFRLAGLCRLRLRLQSAHYHRSGAALSGRSRPNISRGEILAFDDESRDYKFLGEKDPLDLLSLANVGGDFALMLTGNAKASQHEQGHGDDNEISEGASRVR